MTHCLSITQTLCLLFRFNEALSFVNPGASESSCRALFLHDSFSSWCMILWPSRTFSSYKSSIKHWQTRNHLHGLRSGPLPTSFSPKSILRVRSMPHERLSHSRGLLALFVLFDVSDVLVDKFWLLVILVPVFKDLSVFTNLHIKLIVIITLSACFLSRISVSCSWHVFSFNLKVKKPGIIDWQLLSSEVVHSCRPNHESFRVTPLSWWWYRHSVV